MTSITDFIPGVAEIKTGLAIAVGIGILSGGAWLVWEFHELKTLKADNAILTQNNKTLQENDDILKGNLNTAAQANTTDQATIASLIKERNDAQQAIANLAKQQASSTATITALGQKLKQMEGNAANDGTVAPDLRETVRGIEGGAK